MKLSIITVNRNNAAGLEKTIRSVIVQTFTDYEYIIIDGNSTDNSVEIIRKYADSIHYWVSEPDNGIYPAMNKGIAKALGEYVIFMNSGDCFISAHTLQKVFSKKPTADIWVGDIINYKELHLPKITFYSFMVVSIPHQATFIKKSLFDELGGYDEQLKMTSDWKFVLLAIFKYNKSIELLEENIALVDENGISASKTAKSAIKQEHKDTIKEYFPYFYDDYQELYKLKRWSFYRLKRYIRWKMRKFLN